MDRRRSEVGRGLSDWDELDGLMLRGSCCMDVPCEWSGREVGSNRRSCREEREKDLEPCRAEDGGKKNGQSGETRQHRAKDEK